MNATLKLDHLLQILKEHPQYLEIEVIRDTYRTLVVSLDDPHLRDYYINRFENLSLIAERGNKQNG